MFDLVRSIFQRAVETINIETTNLEHGKDNIQGMAQYMQDIYPGKCGIFREMCVYVYPGLNFDVAGFYNTLHTNEKIT